MDYRRVCRPDLGKALKSQKVKPKSLILHSGKGCQFTWLSIIIYCNEHGIQQSMSRTGCPYDNAPMERYFNSPKSELVNRFAFNTDDELEYAIAENAYLW